MNDMRDPSFEHLQLAMARLDILLHRQVRRQQAVYQLVGEESWQTFHLSAEQAVALLQRPFAYGPPPLTDEADQAYDQALAQAEARLAQFIQEVGAESLRLCRLQHGTSQ